MSLATQFSDALSLVAATRQDMFGAGATARMEDAAVTNTFLCYFTPVRSQEQLDAALFKDVHDSILRVAKTATKFDATIGKIVILIAANPDGSDIKVRISEIGYASVNPEHVVGCKSVF